MKAAAVVALGPAHQEAANTFLTAGVLEKKYKKEREKAKAVLVKALGKSKEGMLPDGRVVSKIVAHFAEATFTRAGYDSTTVNVSALSTSDIQSELSKLAKKTTTPRTGRPKAKAAGAAKTIDRVGK